MVMPARTECFLRKAAQNMTMSSLKKLYMVIHMKGLPCLLYIFGPVITECVVIPENCAGNHRENVVITEILHVITENEW